MIGTPLPKVILRPYPQPECLPAGIVCHLWEAWTYAGTAQRIATGTVQRIGQRHTSHAVNVIPQWQGRGVYSRLVLPRLAIWFGCIYSEPAGTPCERRAWIRAGSAAPGPDGCHMLDDTMVSHTGIGFF